ncbi:unnamed protein product [Allacma fusca]|uniref:EF-hand domain-containing protein n=1 Tax=Allacma fusca TaxID=39272 RepID=A0A8J2KZ40_9HEXA|nr:unnamed protein product [Allacma fusca]
MTPRPGLILVAASILLALHVNQVASECCELAWKEECDDYEMGTPCCGVGSCNMFCCNCEGGCRTWDPNKMYKRQATSTDPYDKHRSLDINGDGDVDEADATYYVRQSRQTEGFEFSAYDKDGNGVLSPEEIDGEPGV